MAGAVADFLNLSEPEVHERLRREYENPGVVVAAAWRKAAPTSVEEITRFYQETTSYVFGLAADNCRERHRPFWAAVVERLRRIDGIYVLAYGDGIGTDSIALTHEGYQVTYFDLPGITSDFARFRFGREGLADRIEIVDRAEALPVEGFDAILCVEVLEHLPDPLNAMRQFHSLLRDNGVVLLTESFESVGPDYPSHLERNYKYAGRTHQLMESIGFASTYFNADPINRPMEFRKVRPGRGGDLLRFWGKAKRAVRTRSRYLRGTVAERLSR